ncbi:MAG TPA: DUF2550 domain-containing protein [Rugosimonospora sp.]|nr:DUF2550 domain-containing protein [Rugosimonospora sp.]
MKIVEWIGIGVIIVLSVLVVLFARREIIARGGTVEVSFRLSTLVPGRGWSPGVARFTGDEMRWYRVFSLSVRPSRTLSRRNLAVDRRRPPEPAEQLVLPADWVVLRCTAADAQTPVEIAMAQAALTGFMSWIEAAPPGGASIRFAAR